jgi:hypothetical protein
MKKSCVWKFSKQLLDIGYGRVTTDETGCILLPINFCTIIDSQNALIDQIFPNVHRKNTNHEWLAEKAILTAKNMDINELNLKIQNLLSGDLVSFKFIRTVCYVTVAIRVTLVN